MEGKMFSKFFGKKENKATIQIDEGVFSAVERLTKNSQVKMNFPRFCRHTVKPYIGFYSRGVS